MVFEDNIFEQIESFYLFISATSPPINVNETVVTGASLQDVTAGIYNNCSDLTCHN